MTFAEFAEAYGQLKDAGKHSEAGQLMVKYREEVRVEMGRSQLTGPGRIRPTTSRFNREDPI